MGLLSVLFGGGGEVPRRGEDAAAGGEPAEHGVTIAIPYTPDEAGEPVSQAFRDAAAGLMADAADALGRSHAGEVEGDAYGEGVWTLFLRGRDADAIWEAVVPVLEPRPMPQGSVAIKRYGPVGGDQVHEEQVDLHWAG